MATIGADGRAVAPTSAPKAVRQIIAAGNRIAATPYVYGGGHGSFTASGYDCSGSVSYALHAAGLLGTPLDSGGLMSFGSPGRGDWVTVRANASHAYLIVAGVRFDTSGAERRGVPLDAEPELGERIHRTPPQGSLSTGIPAGRYIQWVAWPPTLSHRSPHRSVTGSPARSSVRPRLRRRPGRPSPRAATCSCPPRPARARRWRPSSGASTGSWPSRSTRRRTRLVYVSPLKALSYDVEKNLRAPLKGIGGDVSVAIRTGDTPQRERQAMLRNPPDVLITTPESLYLMLTSRAREFLVDVEAVIVDEIHAVARTKRGAHMALTLERLEHLAGRPLQRIGLSATQRPLEEVGRFLVGAGRDCEIVDAGIRKPLDLKIHVPVENMREPDARRPARRAAGTASGDLGAGTARATQRSIWPAIYPELLELVQGAPVHDHLREQPPRRRAAGRAPQRAGRRGRGAGATIARGRTTARWPARSGWWSRTSSSPASCPASWPPRRSSSASTWAPWTS